MNGWRSLAACAGKDPGWWFAGRADPVGAGIARSICATCPVRTPCASEALWLMEHTEGALVGVWAGVNVGDAGARLRLRRVAG